MTKTLLERIQEQLLKQGLSFKVEKETYYKWIGTLIDTKTNIELHNEIPKTVQIDKIKNYVSSERNMMDMHIKILELGGYR